MVNQKVTTKEITVKNAKKKSLKKLKCYIWEYSLKEKESRKRTIEEQKRDIWKTKSKWHMRLQLYQE